ncbi:hypothetical protein ACWHLZ_34460 [Streptomyces chartreusis]
MDSGVSCRARLESGAVRQPCEGGNLCEDGLKLIVVLLAVTVEEFGHPRRGIGSGQASVSIDRTTSWLTAYRRLNHRY